MLPSEHTHVPPWGMWHTTILFEALSRKGALHANRCAGPWASALEPERMPHMSTDRMRATVLPSKKVRASPCSPPSTPVL